MGLRLLTPLWQGALEDTSVLLMESYVAKSMGLT
jgi:hypothetical protein